MTEPPRDHARDDELQRLQVQIWVREVELLHATEMRDRHARLSSLGWLCSISTQAAGTILAVLNGDRAAGWDDEVRRLEGERVQLVAALAALERETGR